MSAYRVSWIYDSDAPGCYGWLSKEIGFNTEAEALAAGDDKTARPARWRKIQIQISEPRTWRTLKTITRARRSK